MKNDTHRLYFFPYELLIKLRWVALFGQISTVVILQQFGFEMPMFKIMCILGIAFSVNLGFYIFPFHKERINEKNLPYFILFDFFQLALLLYLTGGLLNPFSVFLLGPILICSSVPNSKLLSTSLIMGVMIVGLLYTTPYPLPWFHEGLIFDPVLRLAVALALVTSMLFYGIFVYALNHSKNILLEKLSIAQSSLESQKYMVERGLIAAACAHELGSPLSTILLVAKDVLESGNEDGKLIYEQAAKCRDILKKLSQNYKDSSSLPVPLEHFLKDIYDSYQSSLKLNLISTMPSSPYIMPSSELSLAYGNLFQNAIEHARSSITVMIHAEEDNISVSITDDGEGFRKQDIKSLGDAFPENNRPNHQGIGLFIAKRLFEQKGIVLSFFNKAGACCKTLLPVSLIPQTHGEIK